MSMFEHARRFTISGGNFNVVGRNSYPSPTEDSSSFPSPRGNYHTTLTSQRRSSSAATIRPAPLRLGSGLTDLTEDGSDTYVHSPQLESRFMSPTELGRLAFSPPGSFDLTAANDPVFPLSPPDTSIDMLEQTLLSPADTSSDMPELLSQHPNLHHYFQSVQAVLSTSYDGFLMAVNNWWRDSAETTDFVRTVSGLLSSSPSLSEELEAILQLKVESSRFFVCRSDSKLTVAFTILATTSGSQIFPVSPEAQLVAAEIPKTSEDLRSVLNSDDAQERLLRIDPLWIRPIMQLLQLELDDNNVVGQYRKTCLRHLRKLAKEFHVLPPSLFARQLVKESGTAVRGGGFADIYIGRYHEQQVCLKVLRMFIESDEKTRKKLVYDFCHEALIWKQLHHPNVLPFLGVNTELFAPGFCLVSPWMSNGDIVSYLRTHPDHDKHAAITEIACGMDYLHSLHPPIVHGDIRGANILVTDEGTCCLADFGLALAAETQAIATTTGGLRGSVRWLAPEIISHATPSSSDKRPRDVYAFACTTLEVISGQVPFAHKPVDVAVIFDVCNGTRPPRPDAVWCPDAIWALVERCWTQESTKRPNSKAICTSLAVQSSQSTPRNATPQPNKSESVDQTLVTTIHVPDPPTPIDPDSIENVMFVGKIPQDATLEELWKLFTKNSGAKPSNICANFKQGCAFVRYKTELALFGSLSAYNGLRSRSDDPSCPRMQCHKLIEEDARRYGFYNAQNKLITEEGVQTMGRIRGPYGNLILVPVRPNGRRTYG